MASLNLEKLNPQTLSGETVSVALASNGTKTLHIVTQFYYDGDEDNWEVYTEFQVTNKAGECSLYSYLLLEEAITQYNVL